MVIVVLFRENLKKVEEYLEDIDMYESYDDEDCEKFEYDIKMESLILVLRREIFFKVYVYRVDDMFIVIRIVKEFNLKFILDYCIEGYFIVDELVEEGFFVIVGLFLLERFKFEFRNLIFNIVGIFLNVGFDVCIMIDYLVILV